SIAAYSGALGAALGIMVANLSAGKRGWEDKLDYFSTIALEGQKIKEELLFLVDEDTRAFDLVMQAFSLPKSNEKEKATRKAAIENANIYAAKIPLRVMETAFKSFNIIKEMAEKGNQNSITDAGVGALCTRTAIEGAYLNVRINLSGIADEGVKNEIKQKAEAISASAKLIEGEILTTVNTKIKD
ncbi:MAG: cyclodeaminase/cyclohydrolase family protein, partial [Bacteroidetes bacterium]|nr:cyclodeaminase/cyclohydrolase family protein [Bacteroidota bacterium]